MALLLLAAAVTSTAFVATACTPPTPSAVGATPEDQSDLLLCQGNEVPREALEDPKPASELSADAAPALDGRDVSNFEPGEWMIAHESSDRVMLMNELVSPRDYGGGDIREYEYIVISTDSMEAQVTGEPAWAVVESSACSPTLDLGELSVPSITLDPSSPSTPESDRLALLVTETDCNSGRTAAGRVEVVDLAETESTIEVVIGIRASGEREATCQGNPATPFTVDLERPLGDRVLLNATVVPAREITLSALQ